MPEAGAGEEQRVKHDRVIELLDRHGAVGLLLRRASSFSWATGGISNVINQASDAGEGMALYTPDRRLLLANAIEAPRYEHESEAQARGWQVRSTPWELGGDPVSAHVGDGALLSDMPGDDSIDVSGEIAELRAQLLPVEHDRLRPLGAACAHVVEAAMRSVLPRMTEFELAGVIAQDAIVRGIEPIVVLVASDERIRSFRHPRPTAKPIELQALAVLCGRRDGLVCSVSRAVHIGNPSEDLLRRHAAATAVDAALLAGSRPGVSFGELFEIAVATYAEHGFADAWREHHQGGLAGYEPRELVATPGMSRQLQAGHACAWNPSVAGAKSEDTVLVHEDGVEVVTDSGAWPRTEVPGSAAPARPDILVLS